MKNLPYDLADPAAGHDGFGQGTTTHIHVSMSESQVERVIHAFRTALASAERVEVVFR